MQYSSSEHYDRPSTPPPLPRKTALPARSKSFQDATSRVYECDHLQMPAPRQVMSKGPPPTEDTIRLQKSIPDTSPGHHCRSHSKTEHTPNSIRESTAPESSSREARSRETLTREVRSRDMSLTRDARHRAYSDSEADNYSEVVYTEDYPTRPRPPSYRLHKKDRRLPPPPSEEQRYYKLPYKGPHYHSFGNKEHRPPPGERAFRDYRPYPARFYNATGNCPYQNNSETTENEYYTPSTQPTRVNKMHRRSNSDSSSLEMWVAPWTPHNKILSPKYPMPETMKMKSLGNHGSGNHGTGNHGTGNHGTGNHGTGSSSSKQLNKMRCSGSSTNVWYDPLLGQVKHDIAYTGETDSDKGDNKASLETFADFTSDVTLNYLRFIWNSTELIRKLIWMILFLGFFIYSFLCCFKSFSTYIARPTTTKYNMYFEPSKLVRFPSITICNMNPHNNAYLNLMEQRPMKYFLNQGLRPPWLQNLTEPSETALKNFDVGNYYRNSGMKLEDFIEKVTFFEEELPVSDAFREQFTTHGLCWTFNSNGSRLVNRTGMDFGLSFSININQDIYPDFVTTAGVKVMFHNYYEPALIDEYGMALAPGTENFISLSYERIKNLGQPYGNCTVEPPALYDKYSVSGCERQCLTDVLVDQCTCRSYYMKGNTEECTLYSEFECVERVVKEYHQAVYSDFKGCKCQDACMSENYKATLSTAEYPSKNYGEALERENEKKGGKRDIAFYRENFMKVHIYFEILSIKEVEKVVSYKWSNLMGDVGGQLGLFLGANIVTIFELVDFYLRLIWYRVLAKYIARRGVKRPPH